MNLGPEEGPNTDPKAWRCVKNTLLSFIDSYSRFNQSVSLPLSFNNLKHSTASNIWISKFSTKIVSRLLDKSLDNFTYSVQHKNIPAFYLSSKCYFIILSVSNRQIKIKIYVIIKII